MIKAMIAAQLRAVGCLRAGDLKGVSIARGELQNEYFLYDTKLDGPWKSTERVPICSVNGSEKYHKPEGTVVRRAFTLLLTPRRTCSLLTWRVSLHSSLRYPDHSRCLG